jgi:hypothetical protein
MAILKVMSSENYGGSKVLSIMASALVLGRWIFYIFIWKGHNLGFCKKLTGESNYAAHHDMALELFITNWYVLARTMLSGKENTAKR